MGTFFYLATEAARTVAEPEGGFRLSFDLLQTNLINLVIILGVLFVYGRKFLGKILAERQETIEQEIREAEQRAKNAETELKQAQQKLAQAQEESKRILAQAEENAQKAKEAILATVDREVERIRESANQDVNSEQERAIAELRERVTTLALQRVESQLKDRLDDSAQHQLIDRSIAQLGGRT